jgi:hypothetical protein
VPGKVPKMPPCDPRDPGAAAHNALLYLKLAPSTQFVSAELTYRDGSVSEIRGSGVEGRAARHLRNAKKPRSMPGL